MAQLATRKDISLRWLELFQICAREGSLRAGAREVGLSVSTVSHHLRSLEAHLGVTLFDHSRRPMVLTPKGQAFLRNIDGALATIRKAEAEASSGDVAEASHLRIGTIQEFDADLLPDLAVYLSGVMPRCDFLYHTDTSHALVEMLRNRRLDIVVAGNPPERFRDQMERPLLRDPFVLVLPVETEATPNEVVNGETDLPFLRFSGDLIIARQIESQLGRLGLTAPHRFECASNQTLMAMVAAGAGWSITTPLLYSRARRFHDAVRMHRFPGKSFGRTLSLVASPDCARSVFDLVDGKVRDLISEQAIKPFHRNVPWLNDSFVLVE